MMGAGKSSLGRELAAASNRPFVDTDQLLQNRFGRPVAQIFQIYGEDTFRAHETSILKGLQPQACVLATGGGIVTRPENWEHLRRLGTVIYLRVPEDVLIDRLSQSKKRRPLLETEDWEGRVEDLLEVRKPLYEQADIIVDLEGMGLADATKQVLAALESQKP